MVNNNFSDGYKKALINSENKIRQIGFKELNVEDIFLEIIKNSSGMLKEIFDLYGINEKLTLEIINKGDFNQAYETRKGVYSGMSKELKDVILGSVKIAAGFSRSKAGLEDFLISMIKNSGWLPKFLDYVGINSSDLEVNLTDIAESGVVDGKANPNSQISQEESGAIDQILGAITKNIFGGQQANPGTTPFDNNKEQKSKDNSDSNTPALDFFSNDITEEARNGKIDNIIGRATEIERLIAILNRKTKNNPVLVGEPGVGKTAVVEGLAKRIVSGDVPFSMKDKRLLVLDISSMVAGTKYRGEFESRIKQVIEEASKIENEIILFIDEIHTIIGAGGGEGTLDASNILKPAMGRGMIRLIGATTLNEYKQYIEKDSALERRFQKINVGEPSKEVTQEIVLGIRQNFEDYHNLNITQEAISEAVDLSIRYVTDRFLPDKAIDLIDEACSIKSMTYNIDEKESKKLKDKIAAIDLQIEKAVISQSYKQASKLKEKKQVLEAKLISLKQKFSIPKEKRLNVGAEDVQRVLSMSTGIPISNLSKKEIDKLKKLPKSIKTNVVGQDEAVEGIVRSIIRSKAGIGDSKRPTGSFLFLGPTGVGKTELVKVLASEFYDDAEALIKIDMSEYSDKTSVNKLIGSSAGYVGYEEGGLLTEKVRRKPYSVVLFDEIEKGDFEVYNLLLQILEEGVLTDNKGRKVNFKNTIIIMTSNIGQEEFSSKAAQIGFDVSDDEEDRILNDYKQAKDNVISNLPNYFSPEFINRVDKIIVFNPLDKTQIKKIVKINLDGLGKRLENKSMGFTYDNKVLLHITKKVYNPEFGAREVRRYIIDNIEDIVAEMIVGNPKKESFKLELEKGELKIV